MTRAEFEEMLADLLDHYEIRETDDGELIIHTFLREETDGELVEMEEAELGDEDDEEVELDDE